MKKILFSILVVLLSISVLSAADKSLKAYKKDLKTDNIELIVTACQWFGDNENKEANEELISLISHENELVRLWSATALGQLKVQDSLSPLVFQLEKEPVANVRYAQILAISRIGIDNDALKEKLQAMKDKETDPIIIDYISKMEEKYLQ